MRRLAWALAALAVGCGEPRQAASPPEPARSVRMAAVGWDATWTMARPRVGHTATLLADGHVLIAGGRSPSGATATTELFDPFSGALSEGPALAFARELHTATLLPDGRVLVAGGSDGHAPLASSEIYDPGSGSFSPGPALAGPRKQHVAALTSDGRLWVIGGQGPEGALLRAEWRSDGAFVEGPAMAAARFDHAVAALPGGGLLVFGGHDGAQKLASIERLNPAGSGFEAAGAMAQPRAGHTATLRGGRVLLAGGTDGGPDEPIESFDLSTGAVAQEGHGEPRALHTATLLADGGLLLSGGGAVDQRFDSSGAAVSLDRQGATAQSAVALPTGDLLLVGGLVDGEPSAELRLVASPGQTLSIEPGPQLASAREGHEVVLLPDGRALLVGGFDSEPFTPEGSQGGFVTGLEILDPAAKTSAQVAALAQARWRPAAALLPDGRVLITGGGFSSKGKFAPDVGAVDLRLTSTEIFDPKSNQVSAGPPMVAGRVGHRLTPLPDGRIFVSGGSTYATDEVLDLAAGTSSPVPAPGGRLGHTATLLRDGRVLLAGGLLTGGINNPTPLLSLYDPLAGPVGDYALTATIKATDGTPTTTEVVSAALPDGRALILLAPTLSDTPNPPAARSVLFSPDAGPGSAAEGPPVERRREGTATLLPTGKVLLLGGCLESPCQVAEQGAPTEVFSPTEGGAGAVRKLAPLPQPRGRHTATLLPDGRVLLTGGHGAQSGAPRSLSSSLLVSLGAPPGLPAPGPRLSTAAAPLTPGAAAALAGSDLLRPAVDSGTRSAASVASPVAVWMSAQNEPLPGRALAWSASSLSWTAPASALRGPGWLFPLVDGVVGAAAFAPLGPPTLGAACALDRVCPLGHCVDGVCCDSPCKDLCMACSAQARGGGPDGSCGPIAAGKRSPDDCQPESAETCGQTGACDGAGLCQLHPSGTGCGPAGCSGGVLLLSRRCDGAHHCQPSGSQPCGLFACLGSGAEAGCAASCSGDADCAAGAECAQGACVDATVPRCDGDHRLVARQAETIDCAPLRCDERGCLPRCRSQADCADGFACKLDGSCGPPPEQHQPQAGCALAPARSARGPSLPLAALALAAAAARRRRRAAA